MQPQPSHSQSGMTMSAATASTASATNGSRDDLEYGDSDAPVSSAPLVPVIHKTDLSERWTTDGLLEIGSANAPLTLTLITHQSCSYCREFADEQLDHLLEDQVIAGKIALRIGLLNIKKYPQSTAQEKAFVCSALFGKGLLGHKTLFRMRPEDKKGIAAFAKEIGVDAKKFAACIDAKDTALAVATMEQFSKDRAVTLVPTFLLGEEKMEGLMDYAELTAAVNKALTK